MSFDLVYKEIGDLGLYQIYVLFLGWVTCIYGGFIFLTSVFLLYVPDHRCALPGYDNDTYDIQSEFHQSTINETIPLSGDGAGHYDKCHIYSTTNGYSNSSTEKCSSWVYDTSSFSSTLGAKLNLVCDKAILKSTAQMVFFTGLLIGSLLSGIVSDRIGRKPTCCASIILLIASALSIAWTPNIEVYMFQSACVGFFAVGMFMPIFVVGMEFVGPPKRLYAAQIGMFFWVGGTMIMAGFSYFIRNWSTFQIVCAVPGVLLISYWYLYPESPRWLYITGRQEKMKKVIYKAASVNKVKISEDFFETLPTPKKGQSEVAFYKVFTHRVLAIRTIVLYVNWIAVCMAYYGLALNSDGLGKGSGIHLYFFLQCLMDIPGGLIVILLLDRLGRKVLLVACMLIGGIACIATMFTTIYGGESTAVVTLVLALIGKIGASSGFHLVYQYSAELFPTVVRNAGMGSCSCMARVGGIIAPLIADLDQLVSGKFGKALPLLVFGILSVIAGLMALVLPETLKQELPETLQDGIEFGRLGTSSVKNGDPKNKLLKVNKRIRTDFEIVVRQEDNGVV